MSDYYLGIDVSKGYADFILLDDRKQVCEEVFQLDDTVEGHDQLFDILKVFFEQHKDACIYAGVESTGGLEDNWFHFILDLKSLMNIKIARINPMGPVAYLKASMRRNVNDAISAQVIAEYLISYSENISYNVEDAYSHLRKLYNFIETLKKQKTQINNQLIILLYTTMPFLIKYIRNGIPKWILELLLKYPSTEQLSKAQKEILISIPHISLKQAEKLIAQAQKYVNHIGQSKESTVYCSYLIQGLVEQIMDLKKKIKTYKQALIDSCNLPEVQLLESFKGIGTYSAVGLLINIGQINRFPKVKNLVSYFGLHPIQKISGDGKKEYHMSKKGRATVRSILFMVARSAIISNPLIKQVYIRHISRGMPKMAAIGVCMHKILRIVYGMLKHNREFDPHIDRQNQERFIKLKKEEKPSKKRRYQLPTSDAPVSRRENQKRKGKQPQSAESGSCGVDVSLSTA